MECTSNLTKDNTGRSQHVTGYLLCGLENTRDLTDCAQSYPRILIHVELVLTKLSYHAGTKIMWRAKKGCRNFPCRHLRRLVA